MHANTLRMSPPAPRPSASPPGKQPGCRRQQRCPQAGPAAAAAAQEQRPAATSQAHAGHGFRQAAVQVLRRSTQSRVWRRAGRQRHEAHPRGAILQAELRILPVDIHKQKPNLPQRPHCRKGSQKGAKAQKCSVRDQAVCKKASQAAIAACMACPRLSSPEVGLLLMKQRLRTLPSAPAHTTGTAACR